MSAFHQLFEAQSKGESFRHTLTYFLGAYDLHFFSPVSSVSNREVGWRGGGGVLIHIVHNDYVTHSILTYVILMPLVTTKDVF